MVFNAFSWPELNGIYREKDRWPKMILTLDWEQSVLLFGVLSQEEGEDKPRGS